MGMPAKKYDFESIVQVVPMLTPGEKETLEIMLQEEMYNEIKIRRPEFDRDKKEGRTFSIGEVLREIEED